MPNIAFPDVPDVAGVPSVARSAMGIDYGTVLSAISGASPLAIVESITAPQWGLYLPDSTEQVIYPDSVVSFEYRGEAIVSDYPIEEGGFKSYNKIQVPFDIRIRMTCEGQGTLSSAVTALASGASGVKKGMTRQGFINTLEGLKKSLELLDLITPDKVYHSLNLVHFDYKRTNDEGVTLLVVDAYLREIQQSATATYKTVSSDSAADTKEGGTVNATSLSKTESAAVAR
ncbi:phage baseplate protein [Klebsiella pneumoniae]|uniref:phage baseplate protein n=1 Tax=Klebsiella pneumoniae TaxID=573 RepID=UPI001F4B0EEF|nr:hypothetical protein [Klebsiella pneumoniae]HBW3346579.1 hypothetical protein [Klebsiella pneumoniae]